MREILERLRQRRREMLERHDLGGPYEDIAQRLRDIVDQERAGHRPAGRRRPGSPATSAARRSPTRWRPSAAWRSTCCRPTWPARCRALQEYEWTSSEAREAFEQLLDELRSQLMQSYFNQMSVGHVGHVAGVDAAHEGHVQRPQPHARNPRRGRRHRPHVRGVHGPLRGHVPGQPAEPRRAARADGPADGRHAAAAQLHEPRAAGPAPAAGRVAARGHGPALAGRPPRRQPAPGLPAGRVGAAVQLQRPGPAGLRRGRRGHEPARRHGPARADDVARASNPGALAEVDIERAARAARRRTPPAPWSSWPSWPGSWPRPA